MNPGGIVVAVLGVWLGCQIFGGDMLKRLAITGTGSAGTSTAPAVATIPAGPSTTVRNA